MKGQLIKRVTGPAALFLLFVLAAFNTDDVLRQFGLGAVTQTRRVFEYACSVGLWFSAAFLLNRLITVCFWDGLVARAIKGRVPRLLKDLTAFITYVIAGTGVVAVVFNRPVTGFWATSGVVGVVLGFALRNIILDIFTGLAVNVDRPYALGDWIMITDVPGTEDNLIGCVSEINWRTTRLRTTDNNMLVVPNSIMGQKVVTNFMTPGERSRFELDFTLDFSIPSERVIRVLTAAVRAVAGEEEGPLADPPPKARVTGITDLGVQYRVRYWIVPRDVSPPRARHTVLSSILDHLRQAGLTLAYPKQDAYYAAMPKRQFETAALDDRRELLSRVPRFQALEPSEIARLAEELLVRRFANGTDLTHEGDRAESMFIVVEGLLGESAFSEKHAREMQVGKLVPGDFFGEMSLFTGEPRSTTVRALTDVVAYEITKEPMKRLLQARPGLVDDLGAILAERQAEARRVLDRDDTEGPPEPPESMAGRIVARMRSFFGGIMA